MEKRKLVRLGTTSLVLTVPSSWARKMGLGPGSTVYVEEKDNYLVIKASSRDSRPQKPLCLSIDNIDEPVILSKLPSCLYVLGMENVVIKPSRRLGEDEVYRLKVGASKLSGVEVVEDREGLQVKTLLDVSRINPSTMLRQMSLTISKIAEHPLRMLRGHEPSPELLRLNGQELFRLQHLVIKCLVSGSRGQDDRRRNVVYLIAASLAGLLGDTLASMAAEIMRPGALEDLGEEAEELADLVEGVRDLVVGVIGALITASSKRSLENIDNIRRMRSLISELKASRSPGIHYHVSKLEDSLRILEIINNMAICNLLLGRTA